MECLLDEDGAHGEFSWPAAAAGIQEHALTHYTGKITQMSNDKYILLTLYPRKTIVYMKECIFLALAEIGAVKNFFLRKALFKSLHDETKQQFLSIFATLPCIGPLPCPLANSSAQLAECPLEL